MKFFEFFTVVAAILACFCWDQTSAWPVSRAEIAVKTLMEIPQSHCLRYFKHDIHLMRRCRNHRVPMFRKPSK